MNFFLILDDCVSGQTSLILNELDRVVDPLRCFSYVIRFNDHVLQADTVAANTFGKGDQWTNFRVFQDFVSVIPGKRLKDSNEAAQNKGGKDEEDEIFGIFEGEYKVFADEEQRLLANTKGLWLFCFLEDVGAVEEGLFEFL